MVRDQRVAGRRHVTYTSYDAREPCTPVEAMAHATFTDRALAMQGFPIRANRRIRRIRPWLRLTPSLSALWITSATALASPALLLGFALVSALGASRRKHPFDQLYDRVLRRAVKSEPLPDNPAPRRFAMALAAAWAATAALLLVTRHRRAGRIAGGLLGAAGATVASTHFCLGSWAYRQLERVGAMRASAYAT
ncbi:MAG: hypothetical protein JWN44_5915 [Myxococcales bacterium]|nr:hypothetical protein [Myxococcales bacterium]